VVFQKGLNIVQQTGRYLVSFVKYVERLKTHLRRVQNFQLTINEYFRTSIIRLILIVHIFSGQRRIRLSLKINYLLCTFRKTGCGFTEADLTSGKMLKISRYVQPCLTNPKLHFGFLPLDLYAAAGSRNC